MVESTFKLDTVTIMSESKAFYYTNTENNVSSRPAETSIRLVVEPGFLYLEEVSFVWCFPKAKNPINGNNRL